MLSRFFGAIAVLWLVFGASQSASATLRRWSGGFFGGGEFTHPDSWFNGVPTNNTNSDTAQFSGFATGPIHTIVNLSVPRGVNRLEFEGPQGLGGGPVDFTLTGSMLSIGDGGLLVDRFSGENQVINNAVGLADNQHWYIDNNLRVNGTLSGDGNLVKDGPGTLTLAASNSNSGDIHLTDGTLRVVGAGRIFDRTNLHLDGLAPNFPTVVFDGTTDAINGLFGNGDVDLLSGATLVIGNSINASQGIGRFRGQIAGNGSLVKRGPGTFVLEGDNSYTGGTRVEAGVLVFDYLSFFSATGSGAVVVTEGGSFGGLGQAAGPITVQSGGVIFPGGDGVQVADRTDVITSRGLTLSAGATVKIDLGGTVNAGTFLNTFDQFDVQTATLAGALEVELVGGFTPLPGNVFPIVTTANSVAGIFAGLPEGALVDQFGGVSLHISYLGGGGNDVTLTASARPGDIDLDGDIDPADAALFTAHLGQSAGSIWTTGDFNGDGMTTLADLSLLQANFGQIAPPSPMTTAVPEPSAALTALASLAAALLLCRRMAVRAATR